LIIDDVYYFVSDKPAFKTLLKHPFNHDEPPEVKEYYAVYYPEEAYDTEDPNYPLDQDMNLCSEKYNTMSHEEALLLSEGDVVWYE